MSDKFDKNKIAEARTILEQIPYDEFRRLLEKTLKEDKKLYDMLAALSEKKNPD